MCKFITVSSRCLLIVLMFCCSSWVKCLPPSQIIPQGQLIINDSVKAFGRDVLFRGVPSVGGTPSIDSFIDIHSPLPAGLLEAFYLFINPGQQTSSVTNSKQIWLQIWRPVSSTQYRLVWQDLVNVLYPTATGRLYKFKVGNRNDKFPNFYTSVGDVIGWTSNVSSPGIVSASASKAAGAYTLQSQQTSPALDQVYNFIATNTVYSIAVKIDTTNQSFVDFTENNIGCGCAPYYESKSCACCQSPPPANTSLCHCPSVTYLGRCTSCDNIDICPSDYTCDIMIEEGCFQRQGNDTLNNAFQYCTSETESGFGNIYTMNTAQKVSIELSGSGYSSVLTGAYVRNYDWQWLLNDRTKALQLQGCFQLGNMSTHLNSMTSIGTTPSIGRCINNCDDMGYDYAGVLYAGTNSVMCHCGYTFNRLYEVPLGNCFCPLSNVPSSLCNNNQIEAIFHVDGTPFSNFSSQIQLNEHCVVLNSDIGQWETKNCLEEINYGHICEHQACSSVKDHVPLAGRCITFHSRNNTWYQAVAHCTSLAGHLVEVDKMNLNDALITHLTGAQGQQFYNTSVWWIGLTKRAFVWSDAEATPVTSMSAQWARGQPNLQHDCAKMMLNSALEWHTIPCSSQDAAYYCQRDYNNCVLEPCSNGGTCKDLINDYDCECPSGWDGKNCDVPETTLPATTKAGGGNTLGPGQGGQNSGGGGGGNGDGNGGGGWSTALITGIAVIAVVVLGVVSVVIALLLHRSRKMAHELKELKLQTVQNSAIATEPTYHDITGNHFERQHTLYDHIDDSYEHMTRDASEHYYKGLKSGEINTAYEGLQGEQEISGASGPAYQPLSKHSPDYQPLTAEFTAAPQNSGTGAAYAELRGGASQSTQQPPPLPSRHSDNQPIPIATANDGSPTTEYLDVIGSIAGYSYPDQLTNNERTEL